MMVSRNGRKVTMTLSATEARELANYLPIDGAEGDRWNEAALNLSKMARATGD